MAIIFKHLAHAGGTESIHALLADQDDWYATSLEFFIVAFALVAFLDIVLLKTNAISLQPVLGPHADATPAGGIHDDVGSFTIGTGNPCCGAGKGLVDEDSRGGVISVDVAKVDGFSVFDPLHGITEMHAPVFIGPFVDICSGHSGRQEKAKQ